ncbi:hypothetical protein M0R45_002240 [Rubus argutus]|uniref:Uncharacterized protein n=1 Tax=Rubus argutus TaxID=59490 RepID=A0AAW1VDI4_RUBAR
MIADAVFSRLPPCRRRRLQPLTSSPFSPHLRRRHYYCSLPKSLSKPSHPRQRHLCRPSLLCRFRRHNLSARSIPSPLRRQEFRPPRRRSICPAAAHSSLLAGNLLPCRSLASPLSLLLERKGMKLNN